MAFVETQNRVVVRTKLVLSQSGHRPGREKKGSERTRGQRRSAQRRREQGAQARGAEREEASGGEPREKEKETNI